MDKRQGILLVIDGIDGSGKTTQIELLKEYLASQGETLQIEVINFPRYGQNLYADLVSRYLEGEFGSIHDVNPYLIALAYAGDRLLARSQMEKWLSEGKIVIANRYVSASCAHLGANLPGEKREEFFKWLDELEYQTNKMPREDLTIFLMVDPKLGQKNAQGGHKPDIHEQSLKHLSQANKIYLKLSKNNNWVVVNCMMDDKMRLISSIHKEIIKILDEKINS